MTADQRILPWHATAWAGLAQRMRTHQLPHALLIDGPPGVGKRRLADRLSRALLCEAPNDSGDACGACAACGYTEAGSHPDWLVVAPQDSQVIKVDQVRNLSAALALTSQQGRYRVALIEPAERMHVAAANALLKTLEEPGDHTLLLLVSAQPGLLPATIRSRCQRVHVAPPSITQGQAWLESQGVGAEQAGPLLKVTVNAPLRALDLAEQNILQQRAALIELLQSLLGDAADPVAAAAQLHKAGTADALDGLAAIVMDLIRLRTGTATLVHGDQAPALETLAKQLDLIFLFRYLDDILESRRLLFTPVAELGLVENLLISLVETGSASADAGTESGTFG